MVALSGTSPKPGFLRDGNRILNYKALIKRLGKVHPDPSLTVKVPELPELAAARKTYYHQFLNAPNATHKLVIPVFFDTLLKATNAASEVDKNISSDRLHNLLKSPRAREDVIGQIAKEAHQNLGDARPTNALYQWMVAHESLCLVE